MTARNLRNASSSLQPTASKVWGYARVSTGHQADSGISLDEQARMIEGRCIEKNWQLERTFIDAGVSGSVPLGQRPEGAKLLAAVCPGDIVIAPRMDRCFRSALDALTTIQSFRARKISLWLLDLGGDCSGNGIAELIVTVLAATAAFERSLISERIRDAKRNMRHNGLHLGGSLPFGFKRGRKAATGNTHRLVEDPAEQAAIASMRTMRTAGASLMTIRDTLRARGFAISHESVRKILGRAETTTGEAA
jgi:DNA invertase Pin-like site-specific DNA recombinase